MSAIGDGHERRLRALRSAVFTTLVQAGVVEPAYGPDGPGWRWPRDPRLQAIAVSAALEALGFEAGGVIPGGLEIRGDDWQG